MWYDWFPTDMWGEILRFCRLEDVEALKEAFGSVYDESVRWILKDEEAPGILSRIKSVATIPPYLGTDLTLQETRYILDGMKAFCSRYDRKDFSVWLGEVYADKPTYNPSNWWAVFVMFSRDRSVNWPSLAKYIQEDPRIHLAGAKVDWKSLRRVDKKLLTRPVVKWLVGNPSSFPSLDESWRGDLEIMTHACGINPSSYQFILPPASEDFDLLARVVTSFPKAVRYSGLLRDLTVGKKLIEINPDVFSWCGSDITDSDEVVRAVLETRPGLFRYASLRLRSDPELARSVLRRDPELWCCVGEKLRRDPVMALEVVTRDPKKYEHCYGESRSDPAVVAAAVSRDFAMIREVPSSFSEDPDWIRGVLKNSEIFMTWFETGSGGKEALQMMKDAFGIDRCSSCHSDGCSSCGY